MSKVAKRVESKNWVMTAFVSSEDGKFAYGSIDLKSEMFEERYLIPSMSIGRDGEVSFGMWSQNGMSVEDLKKMQQYMSEAIEAKAEFEAVLKN